MSADTISADTFGRVPTGLLFSTLPDRAIRLYAILTRYADQHDEAMPGRKRLGRNLGNVSTSSVDRAIRTLETAGWITVERVESAQGDPDTNRYHLHTTPTTLHGVAAPVQPPTRTRAARGSRTTADRGGRTGDDLTEASRNEASRNEEQHPSPPSGGSGDDEKPSPKRQRKQKAAKPEHPDARWLCDLMADHAEAMTGERPTVSQAWLDAARLLLTKDGKDGTGYTAAQVEYLIGWVRKSDFWAPNVRSMPKLREKRTDLIARIKSEDARRGKPTGRAAARESARLRSVDELVNPDTAQLDTADLDPSTLELLRGA